VLKFAEEHIKQGHAWDDGSIYIQVDSCFSQKGMLAYAELDIWV